MSHSYSFGSGALHRCFKKVSEMQHCAATGGCAQHVEPLLKLPVSAHGWSRQNLRERRCSELIQSIFPMYGPQEGGGFSPHQKARVHTAKETGGAAFNWSRFRLISLGPLPRVGQEFCLRAPAEPEGSRLPAGSVEPPSVKANTLPTEASPSAI